MPVGSPVQEPHAHANAEPQGPPGAAAADQSEKTALKQPGEEFCWIFTVRKAKTFDSPGTHRVLGLTAEDQHYAETNYRTQRIALRFAHVLDPTIVTQALHLAIMEYPRVGSRLVMHDGVPKYHLDAAEVTVRLVTVPPGAFSQTRTRARARTHPCAFVRSPAHARAGCAWVCMGVYG